MRRLLTLEGEEYDIVGIFKYVYAPLRSFQQGLQDIISLDQQIVELSKVTGETSIALEEMGNTAIEMATNLGRSAQEIAEATTAFARLG